MANDKPGETKTYRPAVRGVIRSSGDVNVRLIQSSPAADPKLVEIARKFAREFKAKYGDVHVTRVPEAPLVLPDP